MPLVVYHTRLPHDHDVRVDTRSQHTTPTSSTQLSFHNDTALHCTLSRFHLITNVCVHIASRVSPLATLAVMSTFPPLHASTSMPSLMFRSSSFLPEPPAFRSPPSSPEPSLYQYNDAASIDFPFLLPTPTTSSSSSSSSPSSSPVSLSTDDSSDYTGTPSSHQWRPADATSHFNTNSSPNPASMQSWQDAVAPLSPHRHYPRLPPPPPVDPSFRSGSLSSSASSVSSSSSVTTPPPASQSTELTVKKRKRVAGALTADQRLQRRRAQHRAVDANRRQKENEAITRLHRLIRQQQQGAGDAEDDAGEVDDDDMEGGKQKTGRLTVLESSIALIEQLAAACKRMDAACNAKDAQVSRVSNQLHSVAASIARQATSLAMVDPILDGFTAMDGLAGGGLPSLHPDFSQHLNHPSLLHPNSLPNTQSGAYPYSHSHPLSDPRTASTFLSVLPPSMSSYLLHSDLSHVLHHSTTSLWSSMCLIVIALPGKIIIDVNERFLSMTGHKRSEVMYNSMEDISMKDIPQYPASIAAVNDVLEGRKRQGSAVWRCRWADGQIYENSCTFFAIYDQPAMMGEVRMPDKMLLISAAEEAVVCDQVSLPG